MNIAAETLAAYERWAPLYPPVAHNPLMRAEQAAMLRLWPDVAGLRVLDLACGTGRYSRLLTEAGAAEVIALDFCLPMLMQVPSGTRVCASMLQLPFAADCFDAVISGLALAHAVDIHPWMNEVARVLRTGGTLLYSDFHPDAARAGLTRSFKDRDDQSRSVPHTDYPVAVQLAAAQRAGLKAETVHEVRVGVELHEPFAGSEYFYQRWDGLPIVLVVRARK
ncbi:MAG TPA: methyltransferase domain-containing protein [Steroidobacteraceae bacterium]|nr:methyltransferase domain-containing protein [Steroidobacteraceae bacterium]